MNRDSFRFVETKKNKGLVAKLRELAAKADRSLNNYVERILKRHIDNDTSDEEK